MPNLSDYFALINNSPTGFQAVEQGQDRARQQQAQSLALADAQRQSQFQAQQQAAAQRQAALQAAALQTALSNPSPQNIARYTLINPEHAAAIKQAHDMLDDDAKTSELHYTSSLKGYLDAGRVDDAKAAINARISADKAAGIDTADEERMLAMLGTPDGVRAARGLAGLSLAAVAGPDKAVPNMVSMDADARAQEMQPAELAAKQASTAYSNAQTDHLLHPGPETVSAGIGVDGKPILYDKNAPPPPPSGDTATPTGNNAGFGAFVDRLIGTESGGDPNAQNPNSSATGAGQFIKSTWIPLISQLHPELTDGKTEAQILALRTNPALSREATAAYAQENAQTLAQANLPVNAATLAMAHKLGPEGAQAVLSAAPTAPLSSVLPAPVMAANPQLRGKTAGQYAQGLVSQFGASPVDVAPGDPQGTGEDFLRSLPPQRAALIRSIANGDIAPPSMARASAANRLLTEQVLQYDPTASAITIATRKQTREKFTVGQQGQSIAAATTVAGHLSDLLTDIDRLHNSPFGAFNRVMQLGRHMGNEDQQSAIAAFNNKKRTMAMELTKFYRGTGGTGEEVKSFMDDFNADSPPAALRSTIQSIAEAMQSRMAALRDEYNSGMVGTNVPFPLPAGTESALDRLSAGAAPKIYTNADGKRITKDPASGQWVEVK